MKKRLLLLVLFSVLLFSLLLTGCPGAPDDPTLTATDADQAEEKASAAVDLMRDSDYEGALTLFSEAVVLDSENEKAVLGYSLLNIAAITVDPDLVTALKTNIGLVDYPSEMNKAMDPNRWMVNTYDYTSDGIDYYSLFPNVSGQSDLDSDGFVGIDDKAMSLLKYVATHNTGFDFVTDTIGTVLGSRLDLAVGVIKDYAKDDMKFTMTWDMFYDTIPTEDEWPYDGSSPMAIVIGKAEILAAAAYLENIKAVVELAQVYSLAVTDMASYWTKLNPINPESGYPTSPFPGFLDTAADASTHLASAKASFLAGLTDGMDSISMILADRSGFSLSTGSPVFDSTFTFADWSEGASLASKFMEEARDSINTNTPSIFPTNPSNYAGPGEMLAAWPSSFSAGTTVSINFGHFFASPLSLVSTTGLFELDSNRSGEPKFYSLSGTNFEANVSSASFGSTDFTDDPTNYYIKITDATFGGTVSVDNFPSDDPSDPFSFYLSYTDTNFDGNWDNGENIYDGDFYAKTSGLISMADFDSYGDDPVLYYSVMGASSIPDSLLSPYADSADYGALRSAIDDAAALSSFYFSRTELQFLDGNSVYIAVPSYIVWNSFSTSGDTGTDYYGDPMTSTGSFWWALMGM